MDYKQIVLILVALVVVAGCADLGQQSSLDELDSQQMAEIDRGRYIVEIMGCNDCHTSGTIGGASHIPEEDWLLGSDRGFYGEWGTAYPANLRLLLTSMSEDDWLVLAKKMRRNSPMAWSWLPKVTDQDLRAMYRFVSFLGPKGVQAPDHLPAGVKPTTDYIEFPLPH
jgi:hypothetical protein